MSCTSSDNESELGKMSGTTSENECQRVATNDND